MANAIEDLSKLSFDKKEWITELKNKICLTGKLEAEDIQIAFDKLLTKNQIDDVEILSSDSNSVADEKTILSIYEKFVAEELEERHKLLIDIVKII